MMLLKELSGQYTHYFINAQWNITVHPWVAPKMKDKSETHPHEPQETQNKGKILYCNSHDLSSIVFNSSFLI